MRTKFTLAAIAMAAVPGLFIGAVPASAATSFDRTPTVAAATVLDAAATDNVWEHSRKKDRRYYRNNYSRGDYRGDRVSRNTRVWNQGGRYYCKKENGTTGLLVGGAVGALAGHEIAGSGNRTLGALLGAAGGGLLGRAIDLSDARCR
jgi:hypothetical protein